MNLNHTFQRFADITLTGILSLIPFQAAAQCPYIEGAFTCTSGKDTVSISVTSQTRPEGTTYNVKGQEFPADDTVRTKTTRIGGDEGPSVSTLYKTRCPDAKSVEFLSQGHIVGRDGTEVKIFTLSTWTTLEKGNMTIVSDMRVTTSEGEKKGLAEFKCKLQQ